MAETASKEFPEIQSGRYRVLEILGAGAVGTVYKAEDTALKTVVAIKKLHRTASDAEAVRFQREAKLAGSLSHANILNVLNFGFTDKHEPYLVLGYVKGKTLAERMQQSDSIDLTEALDIFIQIARGLNHAHHNSVVHRDLKPTNVMLVDEPSTSAERVKIVDFGMAKSELDRQELTKAGVGLGTPLYMSPEQSEGAEVDARSDLYSFGCLMHEVLTGRPPFTADSVFELVELKLEGEKLPVVQNAKFHIPISLEKIVNQCLRPGTDERYQTAEELLRDLEQVRAEQASLAPTVSESDSPNAVAKFDWRPLVFILIILMIAVLPLLAFSAIVLQPEQPKIAEKKNTFKRSTRRSGGFNAEASNDDDLRQFLYRQEGKAIKEITFVDSQVTPQGYEQLIHHDVVAVSIKGGNVDESILKSLAKVRSLETIRLDQNNSIDAKAFSQLSQMPRLREFNLLGQTNISPVHIDAITMLPQINRVVIHSTPCKINGGFKNWHKLRNLETVMLDYTEIEDKDVADLVDIPLKRLTLDMTPISGKVIDVLARMKNLNEVSFVKTENITAVDYNRLRKLRPDIKIHWKYEPNVTPLPIPFGRL